MTVLHSVRSSTSAAWSTPVALFEPADLGYPLPQEIEAPVVTWDGATLFVGVYRGSHTAHDIYVAQRKKMQLIHNH